MEIQVVRKVLEKNDLLADEIRRKTSQAGVTVFNFMSSPGSGKTTLLERLIPSLEEAGKKAAVIEGDITTTNDAERIAPLNVPVAQINTEPFGGDCHLGSEVILPALEKFDLSQLDIVIIENVGNLVCPAEFDTGADYNVVVFSITEGDDKALKYPLMFRECQLAVVNKMDLAPYLDADIRIIRENIKKVNPAIDVLEISAKTGEGIKEVVEWILSKLL